MCRGDSECSYGSRWCHNKHSLRCFLGGVSHKPHLSQPSFLWISVCSSVKLSSGRMGQLGAWLVLVQTTSKEPGEEGGHLCALCPDAAPWSLCESFWISQRLSPRIVLNGRVSCRGAQLWLVNGAGWQEQTSRGGSVSALARQSAAARRRRLLVRCFTCHERALVT